MGVMENEEKRNVVEAEEGKGEQRKVERKKCRQGKLTKVARE